MGNGPPKPVTFRAPSSVPVGAKAGTHSSSPHVRAEAGVTGAQLASAHVMAQTIGAAEEMAAGGQKLMALDSDEPGAASRYSKGLEQDTPERGSAGDQSPENWR